MKNLFDPDAVAELKGRLSQLSPGSARQWGKMTPAQAMAHTQRRWKWSWGKRFPPKRFGTPLWPVGKSKTSRRGATRTEQLAAGLALRSAVRRLLVRMWIVSTDAPVPEEVRGPGIGL
jgi:hypothetical protein